MKKFLTLLCVLFTATYVFGGNNDSEDSKKMLEKGKTWWYNIEKAGGNQVFEEQDYGVTVGNEVEIDGETWHELNICMRSYIKGSEWKYSTDTVFVAYMREDNSKLYTLYDLEKTEKSFNDNCGPQGWIEFTSAKTLYNFHALVLAMDFSCQPGQTILQGEFSGAQFLTCESIGQITNSKNTYQLYNFVSDNRGQFNSIRNIGCNSKNIGHFFDPYIIPPAAMPRYYDPSLRYVTNASGEIIYEGIGGRKVWEDFAEVESISVTAPDSEVKWYNLQGQQVAEPRTPGIYIRKQGREPRKVLIR